MENNIAVSVIVPCYNVSSYILKSFNALISQKNIEKIEIIFIDDCSTDDTPQIIQKLIKNTQQSNFLISFIQMESNGGYGKVVNLGLQMANGKYICIFEPDDSIPEKYYSLLLQQIEKYSLDACFYDTYVEVRAGLKDNVVNLYNPYYATNVIDLLQEEHINTRLALGNCGICLGIYRKDFLREHNIKLNENSRGYEDIVFISLLLQKIKKIKIIPGGGYRYSRDNISQSVQVQANFHKILIVAEYVLEHIDRNSPRYAAILGFLLTHLKTYYDKAILSKQNSLSLQIKNFSGKIIDNAKIKCNHRTFKFIKHLQNEQKLRIPFLEVVDNYYPINYVKTTPLSDCLSMDLSLFYSYAYLKFLLIINEVSTIKENTNMIVNDVAYFSNIPAIEHDAEFTHFMRYFFLHAPWDYLSKSSPIMNDLFLCAKQLNIITNINSYIPRNGKFSVFLGIERIKELENLDHFTMIKNYYNFLEKYTFEFSTYLNQRSIAIVGNSPCELGKNKGEIIDSHDIVIRFNNFSTDKQFVRDYGEKTNVWALTPSLNSIIQREKITFDYILFAHSNRKTSKERFDMLHNWISAGIKIAQISCVDILNKYDIRVMSMGLIVTLWILENINFKNVNLYGFSLQEQENGITHYFEGDPSKGKVLPIHKWNEESVILSKIKKFLKEKNA